MLLFCFRSELKNTGASTSQAAAGAVRRNQHHRGSPSKKHAKHVAGGSTDGDGADDDYYEDGIEDDAGPEPGISGDVRKLPKLRGSNGHQRHSSTDRRSQTSFGSVPTNDGYRSTSTSVSLIAGRQKSSCFVWNALFGRLVRTVSAAAAAVVFIRFSSSSTSFTPCVVSASLIVLGVVDCLRVRTVLS